jgi:hypothetical protein
MSDPNEHAAYCAMCDRPNYNAGNVLCTICEQQDEDDDPMLKWKLTGDYGTFEITRIVFAQT